jgi:hypothetical protein
MSSLTHHAQIGWRHVHLDVLTELKNLTATDLSNPADAMRTALEHLNLFRLQSGIENFGNGRNPWSVFPPNTVTPTYIV